MIQQTSLYKEMMKNLTTIWQVKLEKFSVESVYFDEKSGIKITQIFK